MKTAKEHLGNHRLRYFHSLTINQTAELIESYAKERERETAIEFAISSYTDPESVRKIMESAFDQWIKGQS